MDESHLAALVLVSYCTCWLTVTLPGLTVNTVAHTVGLEKTKQGDRQWGVTFSCESCYHFNSFSILTFALIQQVKFNYKYKLLTHAMCKDLFFSPTTAHRKTCTAHKCMTIESGTTASIKLTQHCPLKNKVRMGTK